MRNRALTIAEQPMIGIKFYLNNIIFFSVCLKRMYDEFLSAFELRYLDLATINYIPNRYFIEFVCLIVYSYD